MGANFETGEVSVEGRLEESVFACAQADKARESHTHHQEWRRSVPTREGGMDARGEVWRGRTLAVDGIGVVGGAAADDEERLHCSPRSRRRPLVSLSRARSPRLVGVAPEEEEARGFRWVSGGRRGEENPKRRAPRESEGAFCCCAPCLSWPGRVGGRPGVGAPTAGAPRQSSWQAGRSNTWCTESVIRPAGRQTKEDREVSLAVACARSMTRVAHEQERGFAATGAEAGRDKGRYVVGAAAEVACAPGERL
jgi:hypothetical protein